MNPRIAKRLLANFNLQDFSKFTFEVLKKEYAGDLNYYDKIGQSAFVRDLPGYASFKGVYLLDNFPFELFNSNKQLELSTPSLNKSLRILKNDFENKFFIPGPQPVPVNQLYSIYILNNSIGKDLDYYRNVVIPKYENIIKKSGIYMNDNFEVHLGNPETFIELMPNESIEVLSNLIMESDSLSIELSNNTRRVQLSSKEKQVNSGLALNSLTPFHPHYVRNSLKRNIVFDEFEHLLQREPSENAIEKFITNHYSEIFGNRYDRIETQIWLKFPELDINDKSRRLDVFLHNSLTSDWELFELKKIIPLTKTYRDIPTLTSEIVSSIQQVKNYERILRQDKVKESLKKEGIEYFEPSLHLVAGRTPNISPEQWRWLVNSNKSVKLVTYDDLLAEMKLRQSDRLSFWMDD